MIVSNNDMSRMESNSHRPPMLASWSDHARDMLHMINHFRSEMPRPLIGIGHSMGGNNMYVCCLLIHEPC